MRNETALRAKAFFQTFQSHENRCFLWISRAHQSAHAHDRKIITLNLSETRWKRHANSGGELIETDFHCGISLFVRNFAFTAKIRPRIIVFLIQLETPAKALFTIFSLQCFISRSHFMPCCTRRCCNTYFTRRISTNAASGFRRSSTSFFQCSRYYHDASHSQKLFF